MPIGAHAQITGAAIPAEFPPESYTANQYIDSQGCAFIRAGLSGNTTWVPRVARDREQLCGFQPTFSSPQPLEAIPDDVPVIVPVGTAAPQPAPAPAPAPAPVAAPRPTSNAGAPMPTVAGLTTAPTVNTTTAPAAASPTIVPISAPVISAPAPAPAPAPAVAPAPTMTRAQACIGRYGVQPGFISDRTGQPIDCGPRPATVPVSSPVSAQQPLRPTLAATSPFAAPRPTPAVASAGDPFPGVRRATLAEICAEMSVSNVRFINAATGQPVTCSAVTTIAAVQPPRAPAGPAPVSGPAAPGLTAPVSTVAALDNNAIRTGPQVQSPSGTTSPLLGQPRTLARAPSALEELISPSPVPASNPIRAQVQHIAPPAGYERVWDDGRINLNRGLPQPVSGPVVQARELSRAPIAEPVPQPAAPAAHVRPGETRPVAASAPQQVVRATAPAPQSVVQATPSHRFIQVGTYGNPANAEATAARLRGLGLPVGFANATRNGQQLRIVAAGPFASAARLNAALQAVRSAGYGDAFPRN